MNDPEKCLAWIVTLPEPLPVTEAIELVDGLHQTHVTTGGIVLNRIPPDPFSPAQREALAPVLARQAVQGSRAFRRTDAVAAARSQIAEATSLPVVEARLLPRTEASSTVRVADLLARDWGA